MSTRPLFLIVLATLTLGLSTPKHAEATILLNVDITDPSAVVITSTGAASDVDTSIGAPLGVTLRGLFTSDFSANDFFGTLTPSGATNPFNNSDNSFASDGQRDLNLFRANEFPNNETLTFSTLAPAFTGSGTVDLTGAPLPGVGTIGTILTSDGFTDSFGPSIGSYQIIPEPSSLALLSLGGLLLTRRRRS